MTPGDELPRVVFRLPPDHVCDDVWQNRPLRATPNGLRLSYHNNSKTLANSNVLQARATRRRGATPLRRAARLRHTHEQPATVPHSTHHNAPTLRSSCATTASTVRRISAATGTSFGAPGRSSRAR
eukprot:3074715-Prymnesium_polylepis.1